MSNAALVIAPSTGLELARLATDARAFADEALASSTRRAYRAKWSAFTQWCAARGLGPLPAAPSTVVVYLASRVEAGWKVATIEQSLAAISHAHRLSKLELPRAAPEVREVLRGIRRRLGVAPRAQKAPVAVDELGMMVNTLSAGPLGTRDRALLLVGFAGAFRRSELIGFDLEDVGFVNDGLELLVRRSKTDQEATGRKVGVPYSSLAAVCPVRSLRAWIEVAGITTGPVFRGVDRHGRISSSRADAKTVARVVKRTAEAAGLDASKFAGHSLRAGFVTSAARAGKPERSIAKQTGHRSITILRGYIRDADLFRENAAVGLL